ncbi:MAG: CHRD domain-containing protein [Flammeovirgaceae bacterium]|nr:CHRD domain-containing protein [Flammeovirgaceae bacterium]
MFQQYFFLLSLVSVIVLCSCEKEEKINPNEIVKEFTLKLSTEQSVVIPKNRAEKGEGTFRLYADHKLEFLIKISNLAQDDALTGAYFGEGNYLKDNFIVRKIVDGTIKDIEGKIVAFQKDSVKAKIQLAAFEANEIIKLFPKLTCVVQSRKQPNGLLRGFTFGEVAFGIDVPLSARNISPPISRNDSALVSLRLTTTNELFSKITLVRFLNTDVIRTTRIHEGDRYVNNGTVVLTLANEAKDYGVIKNFSLTTEQAEKLKKEKLYIMTVSSFMTTPGLMRGQLR